MSNDENEEWEDEDMEETEEEAAVVVYTQPVYRARPSDIIAILCYTASSVISGIAGGLSMFGHLAEAHAHKVRQEVEERRIAEHFDRDLANTLNGGTHD